MSLDLVGVVDPPRLRRAADALLDRHANLRAAFLRDRRGQRGPSCPATGAGALDRGRPDRPRRQCGGVGVRNDCWRRTGSARSTWRRAPLIRFMLIATAPNRYRLVSTNHHILLDGWSMPLLVKELLTLYATDGDPSALPRVRGYRDYLAWLRRPR